MKRTFTLLTLVLVSIVAMGFGSCSTIKVPANSVTFRSPSGQLTIVHPQNTSLTNLEVSIATNGTIKATIGSMTTFNNPDVIDRTAAGQAAILKVQGENMVNAFKAGGDAIGAVGGAFIKTAK